MPRANNEGRASALPEEITIGPLEFVWEPTTSEMFINRGEEHVGTVEHIWPEVWEEFVRQAKPCDTHPIAILRGEEDGS